MKRQAILVLALALFAASAPSVATAAECGMPTNGTSPKASDALFVLKAAVSSTECALRVCDVSDSNTVTAGDALVILKGAVGQEVRFNCPVG